MLYTTDWNVSLGGLFFSDNCIRNISATKRLRSFSTNSDENKVCTKKSMEYLRKLTYSPSYIKNEHRLRDWSIDDQIIVYRKTYLKTKIMT